MWRCTCKLASASFSTLHFKAPPYCSSLSRLLYCARHYCCDVLFIFMKRQLEKVMTLSIFLLYIFECFKLLPPQKSFLSTGFTHFFPKRRCVPTLKVIQIILLHNVINMSQSQMYIMLINLKSKRGE